MNLFHVFRHFAHHAVLVCVFLLIAEGQHTLSKTVVSSSKGGLALFATKKATCIGCRALLSHGGEWAGLGILIQTV